MINPLDNSVRILIGLLRKLKKAHDDLIDDGGIYQDEPKGFQGGKKSPEVIKIKQERVDEIRLLHISIQAANHVVSCLTRKHGMQPETDDDKKEDQDETADTDE
jgi:hypothetical protein